MNNKKIIIFFIIGLVFINGCIGASKIILTAKEGNAPFSITEGFYDNEYNLILKEKQKVVHHFNLAYSKFATTRFEPAQEIDISDTLNKIIKEHDGDAIVNIVIKGHTTSFDTCLIAPFSWIIGAVTLGFVYPVDLGVTIEGDVVKVLKNSSLLDYPQNKFMIVFENGRFYLENRIRGG